MDSPDTVRPVGDGPKMETATNGQISENQRVSKAQRGFDTASMGHSSAPYGDGRFFNQQDIYIPSNYSINIHTSH